MALAIIMKLFLYLPNGNLPKGKMILQVPLLSQKDHFPTEISCHITLLHNLKFIIELVTGKITIFVANITQ